jgi:hypothetical protein
MAPPSATALEMLNELVTSWADLASETAGRRFGDGIYARLQHVKATLSPLVEAPEQLEARIETEIVVTEGRLMPYPLFR